ncbi:hypothetical protein D3C81_1984050 [compost metagenome]
MLTVCPSDFRFPDEYLLVRACDLVTVFLRRCREQAGEQHPHDNQIASTPGQTTFPKAALDQYSI